MAQKRELREEVYWWCLDLVENGRTLPAIVLFLVPWNFARFRLLMTRWNGDDSRTTWVTVVTVRTPAVIKKEARASERPFHIPGRTRGQARSHASETLTATCSVIGSPCSTGISSPWLRRLSR